jgi:hypothetical protein
VQVAYLETGQVWSGPDQISRLSCFSRSRGETFKCSDRRRGTLYRAAASSRQLNLTFCLSIPRQIGHRGPIDLRNLSQYKLSRGLRTLGRTAISFLLVLCSLVSDRPVVTHSGIRPTTPRTGSDFRTKSWRWTSHAADQTAKASSRASWYAIAN